MRVLYITGIPSPYRMELFNELSKSIRLTVAFLGTYQEERNIGWQSVQPNGFEVVFLNKKALKKRVNLLLVKYVKANSSQFDLIVLHGYSELSALLAIQYMHNKRIPFLLEADGGTVSKESIIKYYIKKHFVSKASYWLSSGNCTTEYFVHYGANRSKVFLYPFTSIYSNEILTHIIQKEERREIRNQLHISPDCKMILSVGRFSYMNGYGKGYDILIQALKKCPQNYQLYIVGDDPTQEFVQMKKDLQLDNLHFIGFKSKQELQGYYHAADLFCLQTRGDIWGLVINEAMANGLPIITTDKCVAGLELVENNTNGYIVPAEDVDELYRCIQTCLEDKKKLADMGQNSLYRIQQYTIENMATVHLQIFEEVWRREDYSKCR